MLPAPAQGAIMVVCRKEDIEAKEQCAFFNHHDTALCTKIEKDFLKALAGGCTTPISALAEIIGDQVRFRGNIFGTDGKNKVEVEKSTWISEASGLGKKAAWEILENGGREIADTIRHAR
jgi:hydroxymethylbilane synthase